MVGEGGADNVHHVVGNQGANLGVKGRTIIAGVGALGPLEGGGKGRSDMKSERRFVGVVCGDEAVVAGGICRRSVVDKCLRHCTRLDGLTSVGQQHHFGGTVPVVVFLSVVSLGQIAAEVERELTVKLNIGLIFPVI